MTVSRLANRAAGSLLVTALLATLAALAHGASPVGQQAPFTLSGSHNHENLTIFFVHGTSRATMANVLSLDDALKQKLVVVHETGQVNALAIENVSKDKTVFVQAGDIVKGGQQDRLIVSDLLLGPRSGKLVLPSFCVEHGRWTQRGQEPVDLFASSPNPAPSKALRLASAEALQGAAPPPALGGARQSLSGRNAMSRAGGTGDGVVGIGGFAGFGGLGGGLGGGQSGVWSEVGKVQDKLGKKIGGSVKGASSPSSLVLTLEDPKVKAAVASYVDALKDLPGGQPDALGYIFAINGQLAGAEAYNSGDYFRTIWPRLLHAVAVEAVAEREKNKAVRVVPREEAAVLLRSVAAGKARTVEVNDRTQIVTGQSGKVIFSETRDKALGVWVHRTCLIK